MCTHSHIQKWNEKHKNKKEKSMIHNKTSCELLENAIFIAKIMLLSPCRFHCSMLSCMPHIESHKFNFEQNKGVWGEQQDIKVQECSAEDP